DGMTIVRVERARPNSVPPLAQIAVDLRARLRARKIEAEDAAAARRFYDAHRDSFTTRAWQVRWAFLDSSKVAPRSPREADLRAWYEGHQAEFAHLDPSGGGIQTRPYDEVRDQVARRWRVEDRVRETRRRADELAVAWARGRGGSLPQGATAGGPAWIVEGGPLPDGLTRALADSVRGWDGAPRALVVSDPAGYAVVAALRYDARNLPGFEVVTPRARSLEADARLATERAGARAWYDSHLADYQTGPGYSMLFVTSPLPPTARVNVPAADIERYYKEHLAELGTPPEVHVRHILVMNDKKSDAEARELAGRILSRLKRGEDFAALAREYSEDPGSKDHGGDLGFVRRGATVPAFEQAAFALTAAQPLSGLVHTQFGYHVLQLLERRDGRTPSFADVRVDLGQKVALQFADTLARKAALDLLRKAGSWDSLLAQSADRLLPSQFGQWYQGQPLAGPAALDGLRADLLNAAPGSVLPRVYRDPIQGYVVAALDSILPPKQLEFEEVRDRAREDQRLDASRRVARERGDRLARDLESGMPWERAVETVGAETTTPLMGRGLGLPSVGPVAGLDSLLFGPGADTLAVGAWRRLDTPRGDLFVQLLERTLPETSSATAARGQLRATVLNRRMYDYIERLRERHPVEVLRSDLAERIPPPPAL
ncbi:MAG: peptidyl-prolyl cis-trans isomerase, partial [Candidatus Eisenbacteria bacterium]